MTIRAKKKTRQFKTTKIKDLFSNVMGKLPAVIIFRYKNQKYSVMKEIYPNYNI